MSRTTKADHAIEGNVIRFEVRDGIRRISCAVLGDALDAVSGLTVPSTVALRQRSFDRFRTLINVAAQLKLKTLPAESLGPIVLTGEDLHRVPPQAGMPSFGSSARHSARPVGEAAEPSRPAMPPHLDP